jgi:hypothetical protein
MEIRAPGTHRTFWRKFRIPLTGTHVPEKCCLNFSSFTHSEQGVSVGARFAAENVSFDVETLCRLPVK